MRIDNALRLIAVLTEKIPTSSKLLKAILQSISSSGLSGMLRQDAPRGQEAMRLGSVYGHSTEEVCPYSYREARAQLHQSLSVMILKSALHAPQSGGCFNASTMTLLLDCKYVHCPTQYDLRECTQRGPFKSIIPKISMFEAVSTPRVDSVSLNWRDCLMREMSRDIDCRNEGIMRIVSEICRDLELRCDDNERPLREEQSKTRDLQTRLESYKRDKAELEFQAQNYQSTISALETERDCLANQVEANEGQLKELSTNLDSMRQRFDHAKIEAESAAQAAIESARQQDLMYLATMTGKDEALEEQALRLVSTESHAKTLENDLSHMRALEANNAEKLGNSETYIETLKVTISALEARLKDLQNELIQTKDQSAYSTVKICNSMALIEELSTTIVSLNEASDQNGSMILALKDQLQKAESVTSELRLHHEMYVSAKDVEFERLDQSYRFSNDQLQRELEGVRSRTAAASDQFTATIAGLHSKVEQLREERKVHIFKLHTALSYPKHRAKGHAQ